MAARREPVEELDLVAAESLRDALPEVRAVEVDALLREERVPRVAEPVAVAVVVVVGLPGRRRQHDRDALHRSRRPNDDRREPEVPRRAVEPRGIEAARQSRIERDGDRGHEPARPERSIRCGVPDRNPAHLVVAVRRPGLGPAQEQRQPQPRRVGLDAEVDGRAGQGAPLPERRLDVHHADDGRAEHGCGCRREIAQPQDVRARVSATGAGAQGIRFLPATSGTGWLETTVAPTPLRLTTSRVAFSGLSATRSRIAPARPVPLRGLIVAKSLRSPTNDLAALRTLSWRSTLVDAARSRNPQAAEHDGSGQHPSEECPSRQHLVVTMVPDATAVSIPRRAHRRELETVRHHASRT